MSMLNLSFQGYNQLIESLYKEIPILSKDNAFVRRKKTFDFFVNHISYDYERLYDLRFNHIRGERRLEVQEVLIHRRGICNSLAVVYKLLLEKAGIYAMCVCVKGHMIDLVQNDDYTFSFDDVTKAIMKKDFELDQVSVKVPAFLELIRPVGEIYDYFNYSYKKAIELGQGIQPFKHRRTNEDIYWLPMSTIDYVYRLIKKRDNDYLSLKGEGIKDYQYLVSLPPIDLIQSYESNF